MWFGKMIRALFRLVLKVLTLPVLLFVFVAATVNKTPVDSVLHLIGYYDLC